VPESLFHAICQAKCIVQATVSSQDVRCAAGWPARPNCAGRWRKTTWLAAWPAVETEARAARAIPWRTGAGLQAD